jgi:hypothetical protein
VTLLALFLAAVVSLFLAFCVPTWASLSITLSSVLLVAIGGGALLAKGFITGAAVGIVVWQLRHLRRKRLEQIPVNVHLVAIAEVKKQPQTRERRAERLAA